MRIFSGIQPSGILHLGNYLGAVQSWVALQNRHSQDRVIFSIVDMHSLTTTIRDPPSHLFNNTRELAIALLACGIDPNKSILYPQSAVCLFSVVFYC
jgi:tryptophanyl-tRNA synthetase